MLTDTQLVHTLDILQERCQEELRELGWEKGDFFGGKWFNPITASIQDDVKHSDRMALLAVVVIELVMADMAPIWNPNHNYRDGKNWWYASMCERFAIADDPFTAAYLALCNLAGKEPINADRHATHRPRPRPRGC